MSLTNIYTSSPERFPFPIVTPQHYPTTQSIQELPYPVPWIIIIIPHYHIYMKSPMIQGILIILIVIRNGMTPP